MNKIPLKASVRPACAAVGFALRRLGLVASAALAVRFAPPLVAQAVPAQAASGVSAAAESAAAVLSRVQLLGGGRAIRTRLEMRIVQAGEEKEREVEILIDRSEGTVRTLARIVSPAFLSGMKFLKRTEPGQPDAQWMKTSRGLRRLGESSRSESVFGSHFTVEDFGTVDSVRFDVAFAPERDSGTERAILARPRGKAPYAARLMMIDRESDLIRSMEYLDAAGKVLKRYRVLSTTLTEAMERPDEAVMEDFAAKGATYLKVLSFENPASIPDRNFNPGSL